MPFETYVWPQRLKDVEKEYEAASVSLRDFLGRVRRDAGILPLHLRAREFDRTNENLEGTYTVRMFSEFETGLREYWKVSRQNDPPGRTIDLIRGTAAYCRIPPLREVNAHDVRRYRNCLVHERDEEFLPISLCVARSHLCYFLSFLRKTR